MYILNNDEEMKANPRRENGITVRFLAQTIINDCVFQNYSGINKFVDSLVNYHNVNKDLFFNLNYYFFLHLEDYDVKDKSEIDFILWNEKVILPVEVKAFTDANSAAVKREIIRNYLHIEKMKENSKFEFKKQKIYPVLLYSKSYQKRIRGNNYSTNYFNKDFLLKSGKNQSQKLGNWNSGNYKIPNQYYNSENFEKNVKKINKNMFFTTWENIYDIHIELNKTRLFEKRIEEFKNLKDFKQSEKGINLILNNNKALTQ